MDAFTLLKNDHKKVSGIFAKLEETTERAEKTRTELFAKLSEELDIHAKIEEAIFYPAIKQAAETREVVLEGFEEHHVIKTLLKELEGMSVGTERWAAKLKVLKENVEHHVEEEEGEMFPKLRGAIPADRLREIGDALAAAKKMAPTHPHPKAPSSPPGNVVAGAAAGLMDKARDAIRGDG